MDPRDKNELLKKNVESSFVAKNKQNGTSGSNQADRGPCVFTTTSNQSESSSASTNGPIPRVSAAGCSQQETPKPCSSKTDANIYNHSSGQLQTFTSNHIDSQVPSTSRFADFNGCDNGPEAIDATCQKHKVCIDKTNSQTAVGSTSKTCDSNDSSLKENRKRPTTLKLNRLKLDEDESSSDTGNDDYSVGSEDGCIYTYRGGEHLADLPSSFFSLDMGLPLDNHLPVPPNYVVRADGGQQPRSRASSPEMDFLEMDFDPGPSCEAEDGDESSPNSEAELEPDGDREEFEEDFFERVCASPRVETRNEMRQKSPLCEVLPSVPIAAVPLSIYDVPSTSSGHVQEDKIEKLEKPANEEAASTHDRNSTLITHVNVMGEHLLVQRTMAGNRSARVSLHVSSGDLLSPVEPFHYDDTPDEGLLTHQINQEERSPVDPQNLSSTIYHMNMAKRLMGNTSASEETQVSDQACQSEDSSEPTMCPLAEVPRSMIWSEREAIERQVTQIGPSACGVTAVINVFNALGLPVDIPRITAAVGVRSRANNAPLPRYLLSRAVAGCTAADLARGLTAAAGGAITARFFATYPERAVSLPHWLADWISLGAVPILTLNLQASYSGEMPDAWHHQTVFGVCPRGIYVLNPLERVSAAELWPQLTSPPELLVRTSDVLARLTPDTDLSPLAHVPDERFHTFNVLGQVVNVIREWRQAGFSLSGGRTRHVRLPAAYLPGVTLAALTGSVAHTRLVHSKQLPLLQEYDGN